jgi:hypothetical protein
MRLVAAIALAVFAVGAVMTWATDWAVVGAGGDTIGAVLMIGAGRGRGAKRPSASGSPRNRDLTSRAWQAKMDGRPHCRPRSHPAASLRAGVVPRLVIGGPGDVVRDVAGDFPDVGAVALGRFRGGGRLVQGACGPGRCSCGTGGRASAHVSIREAGRAQAEHEPLRPRRRQAVADGLEDLVRCARRRHRPSTTPLVYDAFLVRQFASELFTVADDLRAATVEVSGVARVQRLLTSGSSPLYGTASDELSAELARIRADLGCDEREREPGGAGGRATPRRVRA